MRDNPGEMLALFLREYRAEREQLYHELGKQLSLDDLVFAGPEGQPLDPCVLTHAFTRLARQVGLEGAIDLLPSLQEAKLIEHRGDFEAYSVPPKNIQPVIGRLPKWDNAYVAARFGTMGFNMALGTGQCMADLITNRGLAPVRVKTMMDILSPARLE